MGQVLLIQGGGGGTSSDDLTAKMSQVLEGYTAVTNDSDDEAVEGTMPNRSKIKTDVPGINSTHTDIPTTEGSSMQICKDTNGANRINICPAIGYYSGNGGSYTNRPASELGNAETNQVLSTATFTSENGLKQTGTIQSISGQTVTPTLSQQKIYSASKYLTGDITINAIPNQKGQAQYGGWGEGTDYFAINGLPEGYYVSNGASWAPEARCLKTTVRNALGVKAEIIRSGNSIAGVAGTLSIQSAINFSAAAISNERIRISWTNPARGPWQGIFIQMSTSGNPGTGGGSRAYTGNGWQNQTVANGSNYVDISGLNSQTTYYFTCTSYVDNLGWGSSHNVNATTHPTIQNIFPRTSVSLYQYWCRYSSSSRASYIYATMQITNNKIVFYAGSLSMGGDITQDFSEGDGLNTTDFRYSSLDQSKINLIQQYKVSLYIDSTNELKYTWNSGNWDIRSRTYRSFDGVQLYLKGLNGIINNIGCGDADNPRKFRLEFTK